MPQKTDVPKGVETKVVLFGGAEVVIKIDHDNKRMGAWKLVGGNWEEASMNALFEGKRTYGVPVPSSPPLPW